jgi:hypothetical protein
MFKIIGQLNLTVSHLAFSRSCSNLANSRRSCNVANIRHTIKQNKPNANILETIIMIVERTDNTRRQSFQKKQINQRVGVIQKLYF